MPGDIQRLRELLREEKCCAVALVQMGLESVHEMDDRLLQAVSGLCGGVRGGLLCGALTGAACLLNVLDPQNANERLVPELTEWFVEKVTDEYGGADCADILDGDPANRAMRCPALIEETYLQALEILRKHGRELA